MKLMRMEGGNKFLADSIFFSIDKYVFLLYRTLWFFLSSERKFENIWGLVSLRGTGRDDISMLALTDIYSKRVILYCQLGDT